MFFWSICKDFALPEKPFDWAQHVSPTASVEPPSPAHVSFGFGNWVLGGAICLLHTFEEVPWCFSGPSFLLLVALLPYSVGIMRGTVPLTLEDCPVVAFPGHRKRTSQADSREDCPHPKWPGGDESRVHAADATAKHALGWWELFQVFQSLLMKMFPTLAYLTSMSQKHLRKGSVTEQFTLILTLMSTSPQSMGDLVTSMASWLQEPYT